MFFRLSYGSAGEGATNEWHGTLGMNRGGGRASAPAPPLLAQEKGDRRIYLKYLETWGGSASRLVIGLAWLTVVLGRKPNRSPSTKRRLPPLLELRPPSRFEYQGAPSKVK